MPYVLGSDPENAILGVRPRNFGRTEGALIARPVTEVSWGVTGRARRVTGVALDVPGGQLKVRSMMRPRPSPVTDRYWRVPSMPERITTAPRASSLLE